MVVVFIAKGGKPYYVAGMFPVLLAAGAEPALAWMRRGRATVRRRLLIAAFPLSLPPFLFIIPTLPLNAVPHTPVVAINYDLGETIGWPEYVEQIADVYGETPLAAIVTSNYGEAGAVDRYGGAWGLPHAYSGHNGSYYWGPPPDTTQTIVAVGFSQSFLEQSFADVRLGTRLSNRRGVDNDENGEPVWICAKPRADWHTLWPRFRNIG
jgi:hypothetical protein